jgi:hypothetical protein
MAKLKKGLDGFTPPAEWRIEEGRRLLLRRPS